MSDNKRSKFFSKGYYIALILCASAIGITGYVYHRNTRDVPQLALEETYADVVVGTAGTEDVPVLATQPQVTAPAATGRLETTEPAATQAAPAAKKPLQTVSPLEGQPIAGYSMEALSYNQTTRDWRVHNGIDLAAETGTRVCAAADGEVYKVFEDDALGHTVMIRHNDGYTTCYCSLSEDIAVQPGDTVTVGQAIGFVGDSAMVESTLGSHLHFSVTRYDEPMDPNDFLSLGQ